MADKRISQLIERTDIANNDVLPIVASAAITTNKVTVSTLQDWMQDNLDLGVTSVGITVGTSGTDVNVTGSPITSSGNITINIPTASATNRGLLSSADWNTFTNDRVPYIGATDDVDLGFNNLDAGLIKINGSSAGFGGNLGFRHSNSAATGGEGYTSISTSGTSTIRFRSVSGGIIRSFEFNMGLLNTIGNSRQYSLPDANGTLALTSDLHNAVTLGTANGLSLTGQQLSLGLASGSNNGALSSTDWNTFNSKVGGTGSSGRVAFWTGAGTQSGDGGFVWNNTSKFLTVENTSATNIRNGLILKNSASGQEGTEIRLFLSTVAGNDRGAFVSSLITSASNDNALLFGTNVAGAVPIERWRITNTGILQSNGAQTIQTSTGNLTLATGGGNGNILLSPNGTGNVGIGTTTPDAKLDIVGSNSTELGALRLYNSNGSVATQNSVSILMQNRNSINNLPSVKLIAQESTNDSNLGQFIVQTSNDNSSTLSEALRIATSGSGGERFIRMASGTGGIQFNGDTAAANALDDYEEGTFTPIVSGNVVTGVGTYTVNNGVYVKIGKLVTVTMICTWTAHTGSGTGIRIDGLPFTSSSTSGGQLLGALIDVTLSANSNFTYAGVRTSSIQADCFQQADGGGSVSLIPFDTDGTYRLTGKYYV